MTEDMLTTVAAQAETDRKSMLIAEGAALGLKLDKRYSEERMQEKINEAKAGVKSVTHEDVGTAALPPNVEASAEMDALKRQLAEVQAALAAKAAEPAPPPYNAPAGMTTTMNMNLPGVLAREEAERRVLMERCNMMGIGHLVPPRANNDGIREMLGRHMAERAQKMASEEAAARLKAAGPVARFVEMRVLPLGDKKISTGIHVPGFGDEYFSRGDIIPNVPLDTARTHERNGYGEILGGLPEAAV
jgi:hypothetical protein